MSDESERKFVDVLTRKVFIAQEKLKRISVDLCLPEVVSGCKGNAYRAIRF